MRRLTVRVAQVNPVLDASRRAPRDLLDAWRTLPDNAGAAASAGADVVAIQASHVRDVFAVDGVDYHFVASPRLSLPRRLAEAVHEVAPDVVHLHGLEHPVTARALGLLGVPVLVQDHASRPGRRLRRWGYRRVQGLAFTSADQATPFLSAGELPDKARLFAIPESSSHFLPGDQAQARADSGVYGDPALLWVGHLDSNKDPLTILQAVSQASCRLPDLQLWCAFGNAPLDAAVQALMAQDTSLGARVHLLGRVPHDRIQLLARACDIYVSASRREGSGYALIESLACGLIPVVSDIPSFRALTGDGRIGALVPVGDASGFAEAIIAAYPSVHQSTRNAIREHFDRRLSFDAIGRDLVAAYATLLAGDSE